MILALLTLGSLIYYLVTVRPSSDLQMIGTVDANEVQVSSRIAGRLARLTVSEGQQVKAGDVIAFIESADLNAAARAAEATAASESGKLGQAVATERQTRGETSSATVAAEAQVRVADASLAQARANYEHQKADTSRTVALAAEGIMSAQSRDEAETSLRAMEAAVLSAEHALASAEASLHEARAHELLATADAHAVVSERGAAANARALADEARVEAGYAQVVAPVSGRVNVWAMRQGEVATVGEPIVTIMDLSQTWVYAPLPETQADAVQLGDSLRVVLPSGGTVWGKVINKATEADFATQRDVSDRKRDIKTVQLKLAIDNPAMKFVPGMTAEVYLPKSKLVRP